MAEPSIMPRGALRVALAQVSWVSSAWKRSSAEQGPALRLGAEQSCVSAFPAQSCAEVAAGLPVSEHPLAENLKRAILCGNHSGNTVVGGIGSFGAAPSPLALTPPGFVQGRRWGDLPPRH